MRGHHRSSDLRLMRFCRSAAVAAAFAAAALLAMNPAVAQKPADEVFSPTAAISLPNNQQVTRFDIGWVDPRLGEYFLADSTNKTIDVVTTANNKVVAQLTGNFAGVGSTFDTTGPNGVLTVDHRYVWVGDFGNGSNGGTGGLVRVIDLRTGTLVQTIATGGVARADELCYDAKDHIILIANPGEPLPSSGGPGPFVTFIDSTTYKVLGQIFMNGQNGAPLATDGIEQCQWSSRTGDFYLNIPEVNGPGNDSASGAVLEISPTKRTILRTFSLPHSECEGPAGMALGPENQALLGCSDGLKDVPSTVVINIRSGRVIHVLANEDGADEVWFNPGDGHYFLARSGGVTGPELGVVDAQTGKEDQSAGTAAGAHSVAADPATLKVFVPIPSTGGTAVCATAGGSDSLGCIAVFTANKTKARGE
jgi:hypothetical protein